MQLSLERLHDPAHLLSSDPCTNPAVCTRLPGIVSFDEQRAILRIAGDEDRTTSGRRRRPLSTALTATRDVIVDLTDLRFADPSLMIDLACLAQRLRAHERVLWLSGPQPDVRRLIEVVGLHRLPAVRLMASQPAVA
jgi:anti-anti-sigma factor